MLCYDTLDKFLKNQQVVPKENRRFLMSILKMKVYVFTDKLKLKKVLLLTDNPESASHQIFILLQIFWFGQITDRLFLTFSPVMLLKSTED